MKLLTEEADFGLCGDKASWATASYGEAGTGVTFRVNNNPVMTKGDQSVLLRNANFISPRAYVKRHQLYRNPPGWMLMSNIEVKIYIKEYLKPII